MFAPDHEKLEELGTKGLPAARVMSMATDGLKVDRDLLERQAALLGKAVDGNSLTDDECSCLGGLWELVHSVLDSMDDDPNRDGSDVPTIVIFVRGGLVQGIEGYGAVRAIVCDFDNEEGPDSVGGRPCTIGVWEAPEPPSEEFGRVIDLTRGIEGAGSPGEET